MRVQQEYIFLKTAPKNWHVDIKMLANFPPIFEFLSEKPEEEVWSQRKRAWIWTSRAYITYGDCNASCRRLYYLFLSHCNIMSEQLKMVPWCHTLPFQKLPQLINHKVQTELWFNPLKRTHRFLHVTAKCFSACFIADKTSDLRGK